MRGYSRQITRLAKGVQSSSDIPLSAKRAHLIAYDLATHGVKMNHRAWKGKAWDHRYINQRYGKGGAAFLEKTGLFKFGQWSQEQHLMRACTITDKATALLMQDRHTEPEKQKTRKRRATKRTDKKNTYTPDIDLLDQDARPNYGGLNTLIDHLQANPDKDSEQHIQQALSIIAATEPTQYERTTTGRYVGLGAHLQRCNKRVVDAALPNTFEYDIDNCHLSLIPQLVNKKPGHEKTKLASMRSYNRNPKKTREKTAQDCDTDPQRVKICLIALGYGGKLSTTKKGTVGEELTEEQAKKFCAHSTIKSLNAEFKKASTIIVKYERANANQKGYITNALGLSIHKSAKKESIMAHLLQGLESFLMQRFIELVNQRVRLWKHDSIYVDQRISKTELGHIEAQLFAETGFKVKLSQKKNTPPPKQQTTPPTKQPRKKRTQLLIGHSPSKADSIQSVTAVRTAFVFEGFTEDICAVSGKKCSAVVLAREGPP